MGQYADQGGTANCEDCQAGTYQGQEGQLECQAARPGYQVPSARAATQIPCPTGEFNTQSGQNGCNRCYDDRNDYGPAYTTSGPGSTRCDQCQPHYFMDASGSICLECDLNKMNCTLAGLSVRTLDILPGFFRMGPSVSDTALIKPCKYQAACTGGNVTGDASCDTGYQGPLCGVCKTNHFMNEQTFECMECSDWRRPLITNASLLALLLLCAWGVRAQHRSVERILGSLDQRMRTHLQFLVQAAVVPELPMPEEVVSYRSRTRAEMLADAEAQSAQEQLAASESAMAEDLEAVRKHIKSGACPLSAEEYQLLRNAL